MRMAPVSKWLVLILAWWLVPAALADVAGGEQAYWIASRGTEIPVTLTQPGQGDGPWPLVVMAHGHGGSRDEGGGFSSLAAMLAARGIASVRMDFPGCGESREAWPQNTIGHMLSDIVAARDFALANAAVDGGRIGLLGFSMGGRLAMLEAGSGFRYATLALWAPAASAGPVDLYNFFQGEGRYLQRRQEALDQGAARVTTPWGQVQELSLAWFTGLENSDPLQAVAGFAGPVLVLHGDADEIIPPAHSAPIARLLPQTRRQLLPGGAHGLGFYNDDPATANLVLTETAGFFSSALVQR